MAATKPCLPHSSTKSILGAAIDGKGTNQVKLGSPCYISSIKTLCKSSTSVPRRFSSITPRAVSSEGGKELPSGLPIDLRGISLAALYVRLD